MKQQNEQQSEQQIKQQIKQKTEAVEKVIFSLLPKADGAMQSTVLSAMDYSVRAGGKRLRPLLMKETHDLFRQTPPHPALPYFLAAIECVHTYSLVHDDLPAMDNDLLRRGKPTTHAVYGEAMGILCGDALLNFAFELAAEGCKKCENDDLKTAVLALSVLSKKAGIFGMIGGQVIDVEGEKNGIEMTRERLDTIYRLKTSALLEAAMMAGAILGGAAEDEVKTVETIARDIGLSFQIRDDILDVTGEEAVVGKPIGSDEKNAKKTFVFLYGIEKADEEVRRLTEEGTALLASLPGNTAFLEGLFKRMIRREK